MVRALTLAAIAGVAGAATAAGATAPPTAPPAGSEPSTAARSTMLARPSEGCANPPEGGQRRVPVAGAEPGFYWIFTPRWAEQGTPLPMVIDLHGFSATAALQADLSALQEFGAFAGFISVHPQIPRLVSRWDLEPDSVDLHFLSMVLAQTNARSCIDLARVYVTGMSNGGLMTSRVACDFAEEVAAVATVAGVMDPPDCSPTRAMPIVAFHGTADALLPYEGGLGPAASELPDIDGAGTLGTDVDVPAWLGASVPQSLAGWAERDGCTGAPAETKVAADVTVIDYDCPAGTDVVLYRVDGGGHTWPGSTFAAALDGVLGVTTMSISANQEMWSFFQRFALPAK